MSPLCYLLRLLLWLFLSTDKHPGIFALKVKPLSSDVMVSTCSAPPHLHSTPRPQDYHPQGCAEITRDNDGDLVRLGKNPLYVLLITLFSPLCNNSDC